MEGEAAMSAFANMLEARGVTRRDFMKLCGTVAAAAGLSQLTVPQVAQALETSVIGATKGNLYPVIWVEGASCTGWAEVAASPLSSGGAEASASLTTVGRVLLSPLENQAIPRVTPAIQTTTKSTASPPASQVAARRIMWSAPPKPPAHSSGLMWRQSVV